MPEPDEAAEDERPGDEHPALVFGATVPRTRRAPTDSRDDCSPEEPGGMGGPSDSLQHDPSVGRLLVPVLEVAVRVADDDGPSREAILHAAAHRAPPAAGT